MSTARRHASPACRPGVTRALLLALWSLLSSLLPGGARADEPAGPCIGSAQACSDWLKLGDGARGRIYRSHPLTAQNPGITRLLVIVHGKRRDAAGYFDTGRAAAFLAHALADTAIVAPHMASADPDCGDSLAPTQVDFACTGDNWRSGASALSHPAITSFDFVDAIVRQAARPEVFPNLRRVVVAGHSAGGQFTQRYAFANRLHDELGVSMDYVVANPSSYAWPDALRPLPTGDARPLAAREAYDDDAPHANFAFGTVTAKDCPHYDRWPFGLDGRRGYAAHAERDALARQLASRHTVYLLGESDTLPVAGLDQSCAAMLQGPTRRARGEAFVAYLRQHWRARLDVHIVQNCGHNARCMFTSDEALPHLFPPVAGTP
ncbi:MAG: alpha/beta fold hydrolase [Gammaproteobacteria bacterium]